MAAYRFSPDIVVSLEDFRSSGCDAIVSSSNPNDFMSLHKNLAAAASKASEGGDAKKGKVLWLLADACSMALVPDNRNQPFKPFFSGQHGSSPTPDSFTDQDIAFFVEILSEIENPLLYSRLADLAWLKNRSLGHEMALRAIDAYRTIPIELVTWFQCGQHGWARAIDLALMLRDGAGERVSEMKTALIEAFLENDGSGQFFACSLADLIYEKKLGNSHDDAISNHLEKLGRYFETAGDHNLAQRYFEASEKWFARQKDSFKSAEMNVLQAEAWVAQADARIKEDPQNFMAEATLLENAVKAYLRIPAKDRHHFGVQERVIAFRRRMEEANRRAPEAMQRFSTKIDITDMVDLAISQVQGKPIREALHAFANLWLPPTVAKLKESALKALSHGFFSSSFCTRMDYSPDGRLVAMCPPLSLSREGNFKENNAQQIKVKMIEHYRRYTHLAVMGYIIPALEVIQLEHRLHKADFIALAGQSPIVPNGRAMFYGKGLYAGYEMDFATALHLLVPQIEHLVRTHLKNAGEVTTTRVASGISQEIGLSSLMEKPVVEKIFGQDTAFELSALFCEGFGANLRNEVAHGLIGEASCYSSDSLYAWWFSLSLALNTFWNRAADSSCVPTSPDEPGVPASNGEH